MNQIKQVTGLLGLEKTEKGPDGLKMRPRWVKMKQW